MMDSMLDKANQSIINIFNNRLVARRSSYFAALIGKASEKTIDARDVGEMSQDERIHARQARFESHTAGAPTLQIEIQDASYEAFRSVMIYLHSDLVQLPAGALFFGQTVIALLCFGDGLGQPFGSQVIESGFQTQRKKKRKKESFSLYIFIVITSNHHFASSSTSILYSLLSHTFILADTPSVHVSPFSTPFPSLFLSLSLAFSLFLSLSLSP